MKRDPALRHLSVDHHHALVLARRASRVAAGEVDEPIEALWVTIRETFARELEPHFQTEEALLLPALTHAGADELVRRTLDDHRRLRQIVAGVDVDPRSGLAEFGELLTEHVRFEERELFECAQRRLTPKQLAAVAEVGPHAVAACKVGRAEDVTKTSD